MSAENLLELVRAVYEEEVKKAPKQHPELTPQCPPLPRFLEAQQSGWPTEMAAHVADCPYCQKTTEMIWREEYPDAAPSAQWPWARRLTLAPLAWAAREAEKGVPQAVTQPQEILSCGSRESWLSVNITAAPRGEVHIRFATHREELAGATVRLTLFSATRKEIRDQAEFTLAEVARAEDEPRCWQWTWVCPLNYLREPLGMVIEVRQAGSQP